MKKFWIPICTLLVLTCLSGCQLLQSLPEPSSETASSAPLRMVEQVKVTLQPDPESSLVYRMQNTLNPLMHLLRQVDYDRPIQNGSSLDRCKSYFSFSVSYATGERQDYRLLAHQYLKVGHERWYEISREDALALTQFLSDHESDIVFSPDSKSGFPFSGSTEAVQH